MNFAEARKVAGGPMVTPNGREESSRPVGTPSLISVGIGPMVFHRSAGFCPCARMRLIKVGWRQYYSVLSGKKMTSYYETVLVYSGAKYNPIVLTCSITLKREG